MRVSYIDCFTDIHAMLQLSIMKRYFRPSGDIFTPAAAAAAAP